MSKNENSGSNIQLLLFNQGQTVHRSKAIDKKEKRQMDNQTNIFTTYQTNNRQNEQERGKR